MNSSLLKSSHPPESRRIRSVRAFTLVEISIASTIMMMVIAALFATVLTALKIYYYNSDHIQAGGESRRLVDDLIESGTFADDLKVFRDIKDTGASVDDSGRGDVLVVFNRSSDGKGNITNFICYYLKSDSPDPTKSGALTVWRKEGSSSPSGQKSDATSDPATAIATYKAIDRKVSSTVFIGILPRGDAKTPDRPGIFTYVLKGRQGDFPGVLVNLPTTMIARTAALAASSNLTISISPRH